MTPEGTAVKGSYWFIFHGRRDGLNSKLRGAGGSTVYRPGKAATAHDATLDGLTAVPLTCAEAWGGGPVWPGHLGGGCLCTLQKNAI